MPQAGAQMNPSPFGVHLAQATCHQSPGAQGTQCTSKRNQHGSWTRPLCHSWKSPALNCSRAIIPLLLCQGRCQGRCQSSPGLSRCCLTPLGPPPRTPTQKDHSKVPHNHPSQWDTSAHSHFQNHPNQCRASKDTQRAPRLQLPWAGFPAAQDHHSAFKTRLLRLPGVLMALAIPHLAEAVLDHTQPPLVESGMYTWSHGGWMSYSQGWGMGHSSPTPLPGELCGRNPLYFDFYFSFIFPAPPNPRD